MDTNDPFDRWLDGALGPELDRAVGTSVVPPPRYSAVRGPRRLRIAGLTSIPLALSLRMVTALAAAGLAAAGGTAALVGTHSFGAGTGTPASGQEAAALSASSHGPSSSGPASNHGSVVTSAVASCKAARPSPHTSPKPSPGSRGIGDCVSKVASNGKAGGNGANGGGNSSFAHANRTSHPAPPVTTPTHPTPH